MSVRLIFDGMNELREGLQKLPAELTAKARGVVSSTAKQMGQELAVNYPVRHTGLHPGPFRKTPFYPPGNLRRRVTVTDKSSTVSTQWVVRSAAPHAHLFEYGTARRQTTRGANRGVMPKGPASDLVGPRASRARKRMVDQLIAIVEEAGFTVSQS